MTILTKIRIKGASIFGACIFLLSCRPAFAHTAFQGMGGFWSGVLHVFTSLDQICTLLAVGILLSLQRSPPHALALGSLFLGIALSSLVPSTDIYWAHPVIVLPAMMVFLGVVGAMRLQLKTPLLAVVTFACGGLLGIQNADGAARASLLLFALGGAIAGTSLLSYVTIATSKLRYDWCIVAFRASASWIAAIGTMMTAFALHSPSP